MFSLLSTLTTVDRFSQSGTPEFMPCAVGGSYNQQDCPINYDPEEK